nr:ATP-binding cassette domain-containing protein [Lactococcus petauri]
MEEIVSVKNLSVQFEKEEVLKKLSLSLFAGEIVGLIGPSGSGKSTFMNALLGIVTPNSGEIKLLDISIPNRKVMRKIGYMAQSDALFTELTGKQNMEFFGALQGKISEEELLKAAQSCSNHLVNISFVQGCFEIFWWNEASLIFSNCSPDGFSSLMPR